jgi:hypothetical protein
LIKDLNIRPETVRVLQGNIEENLYDIFLGMSFGYDPNNTVNKRGNEK